MLCCIVVSLSELNLFLSAIERIRIVKINKATVVCKHGHPSHQRGAGDSGEIVLRFCIYASYPQFRGFDFASKIVGIIAVLYKIQQRLAK